MKKRFFSNNGKVKGPFGLSAAKEFIISNPSVYGWHPSFNQWKPASCISEFASIIPATEQVLLVPKELTDKFLAKKQRLQTKLTSIDDSINHTQSTLSKFEKQIANYRKLTLNLHDDVKSAIDKIAKKHATLDKKLIQVKNAVGIAEVEIDDAIKGFDQRINSNDVFMPSCNEVSPSTPSKLNTEPEAQSSKARIAQTKLATPHKRVEIEKPITPAFAAKEPINKEVVQQSVPVKKEVAQQSVPIKKEEKPHEEYIPPDVQLANRMAADSFNGMKNMMKSVFKGDKKVKAKEKEKENVANKNNSDKPLSMAERLKLAQNNS